MGDLTPWLSRRQCRRKANGPITPSTFYQAAKYTSTWPIAIILGNSRTGGYPVPQDPRLDAINPSFPAQTREWRSSSTPNEGVSSFWQGASQPSPLLQVRRAALLGNEVILPTGALNSALRDVQEVKLDGQRSVVVHAKRHLGAQPELRAFISEIHRFGATHKFRGPSAGGFRVRGSLVTRVNRISRSLNSGSTLKMGKCLHVHPKGFRLGGIFCPPSTTVAKKLPDCTIRADKRLIWYGGRANLRCPKSDYWRLETPAISDLASRFCRLRTSFPGLPSLGTERHIDAAFTRCLLRPDGAVMFGTEFGLAGDRDVSIVFFKSVAHFGFSGLLASRAHYECGSMLPSISRPFLPRVKWMSSFLFRRLRGWRAVLGG